MSPHPDIQISRHGHVAHLALCKAPHNHVDPELMQALANALEALDRDDACRSVVLSSGVEAFCAGADFHSGGAADGAPVDPTAFYQQAMRLFHGRKPMVAAIEGAAVGAGLGLALVADFRITCAEARFSANFNRLGIHPGFGLSLTLPRLIGPQKAARLFYTGRRMGGEEAVAIGLADELVAKAQVLPTALALAQEIAASAPLAVASTRASLREGLAEQVAQANQRELAIQREQFRSADFREGVAAMAARRVPVFRGC